MLTVTRRCQGCHALGFGRVYGRTEMADRTLTYVLDTSVLLSDPGALHRFEEHDVVIPLVVLSELEAKRNHPEMGWAARTALRSLEALRVGAGSLLETLPANEDGGTIRVELNHTGRESLPPEFRSDSNDHRILSVAHHIAEGDLVAGPRPVVLVSKDLPLRLKAGVIGLEATEYRDAAVADERWTGVEHLHATEIDINRLSPMDAFDLLRRLREQLDGN